MQNSKLLLRTSGRITAATLAGVGLLLLLAVNLLAVFQYEGLRDFGSFVAAGQLAQLGDNPYGYQHPLVYLSQIPELDVTVYSINLNPPISVPFFGWLAHLEAEQALYLWRLLTIATYLVLIGMLMVHFRPHRPLPLFLWLTAFAGFWHTLILGQIYVPLAVLACGAWILLDRGHPRLAGLLIGILIAFKPNFAIWPLLLLAGGMTKVGLTGLATAAAVSAVPLWLYGSTIYLQWLEASAYFSQAGLITPGNNTIVASAARLGLREAGIVVSALLVAFALAWAWRHRPSRTHLNKAGLFLALLASPIAWPGYTLFLLPIFVSRPWRQPHFYVAALILTFPQNIMRRLALYEPWMLFPFGGLYGWAVLTLLWAELSEMDLRALLGRAALALPSGLRPAARTEAENVWSEIR